MPHLRIRRSLPAALVIGLALAAPAGAAGPFDGTYKGNQTTLRTNGSAECAHLDHPNMVVVVQDSQFVRRWGEATLNVTVGPDGSFSSTVATSDSRKLRNIVIKGRIAGGTLDAEIGTPLCAAHLSLTKS